MLLLTLVLSACVGEYSEGEGTELDTCCDTALKGHFYLGRTQVIDNINVGSFQGSKGSRMCACVCMHVIFARVVLFHPQVIADMIHML